MVQARLSRRQVLSGTAGAPVIAMLGGMKPETAAAHADADSLKLRRFLVGPRECKITGITETPDGKTLFVNIQHPGESTAQRSASSEANRRGQHPFCIAGIDTSPSLVLKKMSATVSGL